MALLPPEVIGPISPCNQKVRVRGLIAGATVHIWVTDRITLSRAANFPEEIFDVGAALSPGQSVAASQEFEGEQSAVSNLPVTVQTLPEALSHLTISTHLYECGQGVQVTGAVPGAAIAALINNVEVGSADSVDGTAAVAYTPGLSQAQTLRLRQRTCHNLTKHTESLPPDRLPVPLPAPLIQEPLFECQNVFLVSDLLGGATVTVYREGRKALEGVATLPSGFVGLLPPLRAGELIEVEQSFSCRRGRRRTGATHTSARGRAEVQSAERLGAPQILEPLCADGKLITLKNLVPGARVVILQDGEPLGMTDAPANVYAFQAPPMRAGAKITAVMRLCEHEGPSSDGVTAQGESQIESLDASELYGCASHIFIKDNDLKGKLVHAMNRQESIISAYHQVYASKFLLPVSPALVSGDEITVVVAGCGGAENRFGPFGVLPLPSLTPPAVRKPITENSQLVEVDSPIAGAVVDVYVDDVFRGQAISRGNIAVTPVLIEEPLTLGQWVSASHALCGATSKKSTPVPVTPPLPHRPVLIKPRQGARNVVPQRVRFEWSDPGATSSARATEFDLQLYKGDRLIEELTTGDTSEIINLDYGTQYGWRVTARNESGESASDRSPFTTKPEPPPEPPEPPENAILTFTGPLFASQDGVHILFPVPSYQGFHICVGVVNISNATSDPFRVIFEMADGNQNLYQLTVEAGPYRPGHSATVPCPVEPLPPGSYYFEAFLVVNRQVVDSRAYGARVGLLR